MGIDIKQPTGRGQPAARPFRSAMLRGLAVLCPPLLTILIIVWAINTTKSYFLEPVTGWAREGLMWCLTDIRDDLPAPVPPEQNHGRRPPPVPSAGQRHVHSGVGLRVRAAAIGRAAAQHAARDSIAVTWT